MNFKTMNAKELGPYDLKVLAERMRTQGILSVMDIVNNYNSNYLDDVNVLRKVDTRDFFRMIADIVDAYADMKGNYVLDQEDYKALKDVNTVLYSDRPLTPDMRRDLANRMDALLHKATEMRVEK